MRAAIASAVAVIGVATIARADDANVIVAPTALFQTDFQAHPDDAEGANGSNNAIGFSLTRFRVGAYSNPAPWLLALAQVEFAQSEDPAVLDAYARIGPWHDVRLTVGYSRSPLFVSARNELDGMTPFPELSLPVKALWPGRDLGVELHYTPRDLPFEAWARVSNGNPSPLANDNDSFAFTARFDATYGRGRIDATGKERFGFRIGAGALVDDTYDRAGISGTTASGFQFYMPPTVAGTRRVFELHALAYAGPFRALIEAGGAIEDRLANTSGNPNTPRVALDPEVSRGAAIELAWMITGEKRVSSVWPVAPSKNPFAFDHAAFEIAARAERLDVGLDMRDFAPGGGTAVSLSANAWLNDLLALNVTGSYYHYDRAPIDEPTRFDSALFLARLTVYFNPPPLGPIGMTRKVLLAAH